MSFSRTINLIAKEEYAVEEDNVVEYRNPGVPLPVADALTEVLRRGAKGVVTAGSGSRSGGASRSMRS